MDYFPVIRNRNFAELAVHLRQLTHGEARRMLPSASLKNAITSGIGSEMFAKDRKPALAAITDALVALAEGGFGSHSVENMEWLVGVFEMEDGPALAILWLLMAYSSAPDEWMTPAEAAAATGTAESGWRNKAAAGNIPGAFKKGKQWLLPRSVVLADE